MRCMIGIRGICILDIFKFIYTDITFITLELLGYYQLSPQRHPRITLHHPRVARVLLYISLKLPRYCTPSPYESSDYYCPSPQSCLELPSITLELLECYPSLPWICLVFITFHHTRVAWYCSQSLQSCPGITLHHPRVGRVLPAMPLELFGITIYRPRVAASLPGYFLPSPQCCHLLLSIVAGLESITRVYVSRSLHHYTRNLGYSHHKLRVLCPAIHNPAPSCTLKRFVFTSCTFGHSLHFANFSARTAILEKSFCLSGYFLQVLF